MPRNTLGSKDEIWKDIKGYEGLYLVSNLGDVYSCLSNKKLKPGSDNGYLKVNLCKNNKVKQFTVHRLVALAFLPNENNYPCVNHKDENPSNNNVNNLEWCTYKYNNNYGSIRERISKTLKGKNAGKKQSAGNHPVTGEKLKWEYYKK